MFEDYFELRKLANPKIVVCKICGIQRNLDLAIECPKCKKKQEKKDLTLFKKLKNLKQKNKKRKKKIYVKDVPRNYLHFGRDLNREKVRIRDNHTCQLCGLKWDKKMNKRFDVHHLDNDPKKSRGYDKEKDFFKLLTLCHNCHLNLHYKKGLAKI